LITVLKDTITREKIQGHKLETVQLLDKRTDGKLSPWGILKWQSRWLADSYKVLDQEYDFCDSPYGSKFTRISTCCNYLEYGRAKDGSGMILTDAIFCQLPLCPICGKRRSKKYGNQVRKMIKHIDSQEEKYKYIALCLTMKNVPWDELSQGIDHIIEAFSDRFRQRKEFKKIAKGWARALEITTNWRDETFHVHLHVIVCVDKDYIDKRKNYLDHWDFVRLWKDCLGMGRQLENEKTQEQLDREKEAGLDMYDPWVYVQRIYKGDMGRKKKLARNFAHTSDPTTYARAVAEITKYTCKVSDYIVPWNNKADLMDFEADWGIKIKSRREAVNLTAKVLRYLDHGLHKRQRIGFGGIFWKVRRELKLADIEKDNLIELDGEEEKKDIDKSLRFVYKYSAHYGNYILHHIYRIVESVQQDIPLELYGDLVNKYMRRGAG